MLISEHESEKCWESFKMQAVWKITYYCVFRNLIQFDSNSYEALLSLSGPVAPHSSSLTFPKQQAGSDKSHSLETH